MNLTEVNKGLTAILRGNRVWHIMSRWGKRKFSGPQSERTSDRAGDR